MFASQNSLGHHFVYSRRWMCSDPQQDILVDDTNLDCWTLKSHSVCLEMKQL